MKGYRKICEGTIHADRESYVVNNDYYEMDRQIRNLVYSRILEDLQRFNCEDFYVVVYKKVAKK
jgi:hypothetical protein